MSYILELAPSSTTIILLFSQSSFSETSFDPEEEIPRSTRATAHDTDSEINHPRASQYFRKFPGNYWFDAAGLYVVNENILLFGTNDIRFPNCCNACKGHIFLRFRWVLVQTADVESFYFCFLLTFALLCRIWLDIGFIQMCTSLLARFNSLLLYNFQ